MLGLKISTLSEWNQIFDEGMHPLIVPDERGTRGKITVPIVRRIVEIAKNMLDKGRRLRIKSFTRQLATEEDMIIAGHEIELLPAGSGNPKGNGTVECAFSGMKEAIGAIVLDTTSPVLLAKSVLEKLVPVYIALRNRLRRFGDRRSAEEIMMRPVSQWVRQQVADRYKKRAEKKDDPERQQKIDRLDGIIRYHRLEIDEASLKRAQTCIVHYNCEAIAKSEQAFLIAVGRDRNRCTLPYFFGILNRVQAAMDEKRYKDYCYNRYNERQMEERERQKRQDMKAAAEPTTVENLAAMLAGTVTAKIDFIKEAGMRQVSRMVENLKNQYQYLEVLKKKIADALGEIPSLSLSQRQEAFNLVEQYLA